MQRFKYFSSIQGISSGTLLALALSTGAMSQLAADEDSLVALAEQIQLNSANASEADILRLLEMAAQEGRALEASTAVDTWLSSNFTPSPAVLLAAARNARQAGNLRTASERYAAFFERAEPSAEAGKAAGEFLFLTTVLLNDSNSPYQFFLRDGLRFRGHPSVQRYDLWLLNEALLREDFGTAIKAMNAMLVPGLDQGVERIHYHPVLHRLAEALFASRQPTVEAADSLQSIVERARMRDTEKAHLLFLINGTRLAASRLAGEERFIEQYMKSSIDNARAFLTARPTLESYRTVLRVFAHNPSNGRWSNDLLNELGDHHARLVVVLLERASEEEKKSIFEHRFGSNQQIGAYAANPLTWYRVGARESRLFITDSHSLNFSEAFPDTANDIARQVEALQGILANTPGGFAAAVRALHAGRGDAARTAEAWFGREAWALDARTTLDMWASVVEPALAKRMGLNDGMSDEVYASAIASWVGRSIRLRYDRDAMRNHLRRSFEGNRSDFADRIHEILWLPLTDDVRNRGISEFIRRDFGRWRDWVRSAANNERNRNHEEAKPLLPIAERLQPVIDMLGGTNDIDPQRAPDALSRSWAQAVEAVERNRHEDAAQALKQVASELSNGPSSSAAQATAILEDILSSDRWNGPAYAAQLEVLAAALRGWKDGNGPHEQLLRSFMGRTRDWWGRTRREEREAVLAAHAIIAQAVREAHDQGSIPTILFEAFLDTRRGRNWRESEVSSDIFIALMERGTLWTTGTTVVEAMRLVRNDFPELRERFPIESWFDDRAVAEAQERNHFDADYWEFGRDQRGVVRKAAWEHFGGQVPPLLGTGSLRVYDLDDHDEWMRRLLINGVEHVGRRALETFEGNFADRKDVWAAGLAWFRRSTAETDLGEFRMRASNYLAAASVLPGRVPGIDLRVYENVSAADFTDADRQVLRDLFVDLQASAWPSRAEVEETALKLARSLKKVGNNQDLRRVAPTLWQLAEQTRSSSLAGGLLEILKEFVREENTEMIASFGGGGVDIAQEALNANQRRDIESIVATARSVMGPAINIPQTDPRYPVYAAQQNWSIGRNQGAWEMLGRAGATELMHELVGELNPQFLLWTVSELTRRERLDKADLLTRAVLTWMDTVNVPLPTEFRAEVLLSRAKIAMRRGALPVARAQFRVIAEDDTFVGLPQQTAAELLTAEVDRLSGRFDEADDILRRLARSPDSQVRANALFGQAKIRKDQEDTEAARRLLDRAMVLNTSLEMVFFQKELQLALRDYLSARQWGWGTGNDRIVPGRMLEIAIEDRNRVIARNFSSIELRVWSEKAGDEETLILTMADDRGELFTGEIPTELGPARQGDRRLQVLGGDTIHYDLSEEFVRRVNFERTGPTVQSVQVASDGELIASSGTILSREERRRLAEERLFGARQEQEVGPLSDRRQPNQIRPGNKINVQVIDPSRSVTLHPDRITIQASASSGDRIGAFELMETGSSSGVFEGAIPTDRLPARAFASDTAAGADPNVMISPSENLPPWMAATGIDGPRYVGVDFNDLIDFKEFVVEGVEDRRIRRILVEGSLNNRDFQALASWPDALEHWQGSPQITMALLPGGVGNSYAELNAYLQRSAIDPRYGVKSQPMTGNGFAFRWDEIKKSWESLPRQIPGLESRGRRRGSDPGNPVLVRARSAFWVDERQTFTFYLASEQSSDLGAARLFINGQELSGPARRRGATDEVPEFQIELGRGLHVMEMMRVVGSNQGDQITTELRTASSAPPYIVPVDRSFFDVSAAGPLLANRFPGPTTMAEQGGTNRFVVDLEGRSTRTLRVWLMDVEGGVPALRKLHATTAKGKAILPLEQDFDELRRNQILEIGAGDSITITYNDPTPYNDNNNVHEVFMQANYSNATVQAAFPVANERGRETMAAVRRFEAGDAIRVFIRDADEDTTSEPDVVSYRVETSSGRSIELDAVETGPHTGVFLSAFFPVKREPTRDSEIQVVPGDDITITYRDQENTEPGIPWDRVNLIEQVVWRDPELRVASTFSEPIPEEEIAAAEINRERARERAREQGLPTTEIDASSVPRYRLIVERPAEGATVANPVEDKATHVLGANLQVEVLWPTVAKSTASRVTIYAQTSTGRAAADVQDGEPFDTAVPGTVAFEVPASTIGGASDLPDGHMRGPVVGTQLLGSAMDQGAFTASIPVRFGDNHTESLVGRPDLTPDQRALLVTAEDTIFLAFAYEDQEGRQQWLTRRVGLSGSTLFEVYDRTWNEPVTELHVGEQIYLQATDPLSNTSGERDRVKVEITTGSGWSGSLSMMETLSHSGIFRTVATFVHNEATIEREDLNAIPVIYGDTVTIRYPGRGGTVERQMRIHKGADGEVVPFSKRYQDDEMAMGTLFSIAEAYFELAKQQRRMAEDASNRADTAGEARFLREVRNSIDAGRDVLEEAIRQFPDSALRAQADYLMAELELEFATDTESEDDRRRYFENALQRFASILGSYPDSEYAPRAQYKLGFVYEEMGEMTAASQEYVKLSFRYPDHELVADAMIRLARYFQGEGRRIQAESERLTESDFPRSQVLLRDARNRFGTAGDVLSRLVERFPTHPNAAAAGVAAGTSFISANRFEEAVAVLDTIANDPSIDAPMIKAEALYWLGDAYLKMMQHGAVPRGVDARGRAEIAFTTCTVNYPESLWARRSRGVLDELSRRGR